MNNLEQHKRSDAIKWVAVFLAVILLAVAVSAALTQGFTNANPYGWLDKDNNDTGSENQTNDESLNGELCFTDVVENGLLLSFGEATTAADSASISKSLTATVLPADAPDKTVTWSVAWTDDSSRKSQNVADYIKVIPASEGSNEATVHCYKGFEGDVIVITCKTNKGSFTANCSVSYLGYPDSLTISNSSLSMTKDSSWNINMYNLDCGTNYTFDLNLSNKLNEVGSTFGNYKLSLAAHGGCVYDIKAYNTEGTLTSQTTTSMNAIGSGETLDTNGDVYATIQCGNNFFSLCKAHVENGKLIVTAITPCTAIKSTVYGRGGHADNTFKSYVDNKAVYYTLTVTETTSGISKSIDFKGIASVTSVSLSSESLAF